MGSYRRAIIVIALPLPREVTEVIYLAQKPLYKYLDQNRRSRIRRSEIQNLTNHPSYCVCSRCYRVDSLGCKIILNYIMPVLPDPGILYDPERRETLLSILSRFRRNSTREMLRSLIQTNRLPWGKPVFIFNTLCNDVISPSELMEEIRDSVPISLYASQNL